MNEQIRESPQKYSEISLSVPWKEESLNNSLLNNLTGGVFRQAQSETWQPLLRYFPPLKKNKIKNKKGKIHIEIEDLAE